MMRLRMMILPKMRWLMMMMVVMRMIDDDY